MNKIDVAERWLASGAGHLVHARFFGEFLIWREARSVGDWFNMPGTHLREEDVVPHIISSFLIGLEISLKGLLILSGTKFSRKSIEIETLLFELEAACITATDDASYEQVCALRKVLQRHTASMSLKHDAKYPFYKSGKVTFKKKYFKNSDAAQKYLRVLVTDLATVSRIILILWRFKVPKKSFERARAEKNARVTKSIFPL